MAASGQLPHPFALFEPAHRPTWALPAPLATTHPRLLATDADFARLRQVVSDDRRAARWHAQLSRAASAMLALPTATYAKPDGVSLLVTSRQVLDRVYTLALLGRIDDNPAFVRRAWAELEAAAHFPDWNPAHFLDTAEMTHAVAIGYDWLYGCWSSDQRARLLQAIVDHGLRPALRAYEGATTPGAMGNGTPYNWWTTVRHNWNLVCNAGIGLGALAVGDDPQARSLASAVLTHGLRSLRLALPGLAPDGGWAEGLGYWHYAIRYLTAFTAALHTALGTDLGISQTPGFDRTGDFPIYLTGPSGQSFNFADSDAETPNVAELFWLAGRFKQPRYAARQVAMADTTAVAQDLLWYQPALAQARSTAGEPRDRWFRGVDVVSFRAAWDDPHALFLAFKGGDNQANHADLDLGSFVLDALGVRWAVDLGADAYALPGYFDNALHGRRWSYYRKRAEGHNTLVIDPGHEADQYPLARARVRSVASTPAYACGTVDLGEAYAGHVRSVQRGLALTNGRRWALVQDEIHAVAPVTIHWFMHTGAASMRTSPNGREVTLRQGGMRLWLRLLSPSDAAFEVTEPHPLPTSPSPAGQSRNDGIRRVAITLRPRKDARLAVLFVPLLPGAAPPAITPDVHPLAAWPVGLPRGR
jgi:hypothetical protein